MNCMNPMTGILCNGMRMPHAHIHFVFRYKCAIHTHHSHTHTHTHAHDSMKITIFAHLSLRRCMHIAKKKKKK